MSGFGLKPRRRGLAGLLGGGLAMSSTNSPSKAKGKAKPGTPPAAVAPVADPLEEDGYASDKERTVEGRYDSIGLLQVVIYSGNDLPLNAGTRGTYAALYR